jgi:hypothetical protein
MKSRRVLRTIKSYGVAAKEKTVAEPVDSDSELELLDTGERHVGSGIPELKSVLLKKSLLISLGKMQNPVESLRT